MFSMAQNWYYLHLVDNKVPVLTAARVAEYGRLSSALRLYIFRVYTQNKYICLAPLAPNLSTVQACTTLKFDLN